jgi:hypothetical protein
MDALIDSIVIPVHYKGSARMYSIHYAHSNTILP